MPDLQPFNTGETATSIRTKINAAIAKINTLDDANEIIAKLDAELGSTSWKNSIITLNNIAELKAYDVGTVVDKTVAVVYGASDAGDGDGGTFYWDQASSQTADGIITIAPNSGDSGRWIKVQTALSGLDIQTTIIEADTNDTALADIGAIKDWVESITSELEALIGVPRFVGITHIDKYDQVANSEYEYDLTTFGGITPSKAVGIYVVCYTNSTNGSTGQSNVSTNLGGGETFTSIKSQYNYEDAGSSAMVMIPLSEGQTTFKLKSSSPGNNDSRYRHGWTIVGVSQY